MCVTKRKLKFKDYKQCLKSNIMKSWKYDKIFRKERNWCRLSDRRQKRIVCRLKNKLILKTQRRFKNEKQVFTVEINKIALSSNDDKRMQSIYSIETYAHGMTYDLSGFKSRVNRHLLLLGSF